MEFSRLDGSCDPRYRRIAAAEARKRCLNVRFARPGSLASNPIPTALVRIAHASDRFRGTMTERSDEDVRRTSPDDASGADAGGLSHVVESAAGSRARMVDVGAKASSERSALARASVVFPEGLMERVVAGDGPKGPVTEVARTAGILAAKRTGELIPLCHPLALDHVDVEFEPCEGGRLEVRCRAACHGRTGVEMEALVGASIAALTVYDMAKALHKGIRLEAVELVEKRGGKSGHWRRSEP